MRVWIGFAVGVMVGVVGLVVVATVLWLADPTNGETLAEERQRLWGQDGGQKA